jgi:5-methylcytosine-specific restriction endonuclease McrA
MPRRAPMHRGIGQKSPEARKEAFEASRPRAHRRGYDGVWRALRARFLAMHPWCSEEGCDAAATDVDHVVSVREAPERRLDWNNLRPLCHSHHSARTSRDHSWNRPQ